MKTRMKPINLCNTRTLHFYRPLCAFTVKSFNNLMQSSRMGKSTLIYHILPHSVEKADLPSSEDTYSAKLTSMPVSVAFSVKAFYCVIFR